MGLIVLVSLVEELDHLKVRKTVEIVRLGNDDSHKQDFDQLRGPAHKKRPMISG